MPNWVARTLIALGVAILGCCAAWLALVTIPLSSWTSPTPAAAFGERSIGLETFPVKYAVVLAKVSGRAFHTGTEHGRDLWANYGFIPNLRAASDRRPACADNAADKLPVGFVISNRLPVVAATTPVQFAGLSCATCHTGVLRTADGRVSAPIVGMGNPELDSIAFTDALKDAVLDPALDATTILAAYDAQCGAPGLLQAPQRLIERFLIANWLSGVRASFALGMTQYDMPFHGAALKDAAAIAPGPMRTRPFRSIVRVALNLPGADNMAMSRIPVVFEQDRSLRPWSQYDASIGDPVTRAMIAAYTSGASVEALSHPETVATIRQAARFTERLGIDTPVPRFRDLFPANAPPPAAVAAGFKVYQAHCTQCHGSRPIEDGPWSLASATLAGRRNMRVGDVVPGLGVDPARIHFRYADILPLVVWTNLPVGPAGFDAQLATLTAAQAGAARAGDPALAYVWQQQAAALTLGSKKYRTGHPLAFAAADVVNGNGYVNAPIPRVFLRAPYLHNASVPTLRELINLDPRPAIFCRGQNKYDPVAVGYIAPAPGADGKCPPPLEFRFDTSQPGNGNRGHDYPWALTDPARDPVALENLLAYLKTL